MKTYVQIVCLGITLAALAGCRTTTGGDSLVDSPNPVFAPPAQVTTATNTAALKAAPGKQAGEWIKLPGFPGLLYKPLYLNDSVLVSYDLVELICAGETIDILGYMSNQDLAAFRKANPGNFIAVGMVRGNRAEILALDPLQNEMSRGPGDPLGSDGLGFSLERKLTPAEMTLPDGSKKTFFSAPDGVMVTFFRISEPLVQCMLSNLHTISFWGVLDNGKCLAIGTGMDVARDVKDPATGKWQYWHATYFVRNQTDKLWPAIQHRPLGDQIQCSSLELYEHQHREQQPVFVQPNHQQRR